MSSPSTNPKLAAGTPFASWGANLVQLGRRERRGLARFPQSARNTWPTRVPLGLSSCCNTSPVFGFQGVAVGAVSGYPDRSNRKKYSGGALSLGAADTATSTTGHSMSATIRHLPRSTPSMNLMPATWSRKTRSSGDMEAPPNPLSLESFPRKKVKTDGAIVIREEADVVRLV